ncbi:hypothetical protein ACFRCI_36295 [Streptomyces sp. NPDC056638]|uniref:hypothetical protein n=1 Tax=Streptomyces sp. NPDC056638 TaxID=3345887 RepID=UPI00368958D6
MSEQEILDHGHILSADKRVFLDTLARLPAVRRPWLRELYDRVRKERNTFLGQETDRKAAEGAEA